MSDRAVEWHVDESQCLLQRQWHAHLRSSDRDQRRRRAFFALALIAEPLELQWNEVFLDMAFWAWHESVRRKCLARDLLEELREQSESRGLLKRQSQGRRRGVLALALIAEPLQKEWSEVFLDLAFSAWFECLASRQREQAAFEIRQLLKPELDQCIMAPQHRRRLQTAFASHSAQSMLAGQWSSLLKEVAPALTPRELEISLSNMLRDKDQRISVDSFVRWLCD
mmetsp:Transcript_1938/g.3618  ORF Transcript_1938/g.3618 Transcript_1938/m.3618 type:complete len:225 (-) Transcript_1938:51-725(-)